MKKLSDPGNIAQASDFINETENGFKHPIAGRVNISGGQKQRLSITLSRY